MRYIPTDADKSFYELYCRTMDAIVEALPKPVARYATETSSQAEPSVWRRAWIESDMSGLLKDAYNAVTAVAFYPLGLTKPNGVCRYDPRIVIEWKREQCGILVTECTRPTPPARRLLRRSTLYGVNGTVIPGLYVCYIVPDQERVTTRVCDQVVDFYKQTQRN